MDFDLVLQRLEISHASLAFRWRKVIVVIRGNVRVEGHLAVRNMATRASFRPSTLVRDCVATFVAALSYLVPRIEWRIVEHPIILSLIIANVGMISASISGGVSLRVESFAATTTDGAVVARLIASIRMDIDSSRCPARVRRIRGGTVNMFADAAALDQVVAATKQQRQRPRDSSGKYAILFDAIVACFTAHRVGALIIAAVCTIFAILYALRPHLQLKQHQQQQRISVADDAMSVAVDTLTVELAAAENKRVWHVEVSRLESCTSGNLRFSALSLSAASVASLYLSEVVVLEGRVASIGRLEATFHDTIWLQRLNVLSQRHPQTSAWPLALRVSNMTIRANLEGQSIELSISRALFVKGRDLYSCELRKISTTLANRGRCTASASASKISARRRPNMGAMSLNFACASLIEVVDGSVFDFYSQIVNALPVSTKEANGVLRVELASTWRVGLRRFVLTGSTASGLVALSSGFKIVRAFFADLCCSSESDVIFSADCVVVRPSFVRASTVFYRFERRKLRALFNCFAGRGLDSGQGEDGFRATLCNVLVVIPDSRARRAELRLASRVLDLVTDDAKRSAYIRGYGINMFDARIATQLEICVRDRASHYVVDLGTGVRLPCLTETQYALAVAVFFGNFAEEDDEDSTDAVKAEPWRVDVTARDVAIKLGSIATGRGACAWATLTAPGAVLISFSKTSTTCSLGAVAIEGSLCLTEGTSATNITTNMIRVFDFRYEHAVEEIAKTIVNISARFADASLGEAGALFVGEIIEFFFATFKSVLALFLGGNYGALEDCQRDLTINVDKGMAMLFRGGAHDSRNSGKSSTNPRTSCCRLELSGPMNYTRNLRVNAADRKMTLQSSLQVDVSSLESVNPRDEARRQILSMPFQIRVASTLDSTRSAVPVKQGDAASICEVDHWVAIRSMELPPKSNHGAKEGASLVGTFPSIDLIGDIVDVWALKACLKDVFGGARTKNGLATTSHDDLWSRSLQEARHLVSRFEQDGNVVDSMSATVANVAAHMTLLDSGGRRFARMSAAGDLCIEAAASLIEGRADVTISLDVADINDEHPDTSIWLPVVEPFVARMIFRRRHNPTEDEVQISCDDRIDVTASTRSLLALRHREWRAIDSPARWRNESVGKRTVESTLGAQEPECQSETLQILLRHNVVGARKVRVSLMAKRRGLSTDQVHDISLDSPGESVVIGDDRDVAHGIYEIALSRVELQSQDKSTSSAWLSQTSRGKSHVGIRISAAAVDGCETMHLIMLQRGDIVTAIVATVKVCTQERSSLVISLRSRLSVENCFRERAIELRDSHNDRVWTLAPATILQLPFDACVGCLTARRIPDQSVNPPINARTISTPPEKQWTRITNLEGDPLAQPRRRTRAGPFVIHTTSPIAPQCEWNEDTALYPSAGFLHEGDDRPDLQQISFDAGSSKKRMQKGTRLWTLVEHHALRPPLTIINAMPFPLAWELLLPLLGGSFFTLHDRGVLAPNGSTQALLEKPDTDHTMLQMRIRLINYEWSKRFLVLTRNAVNGALPDSEQTFGLHLDALQAKTVSKFGTDCEVETVRVAPALNLCIKRCCDSVTLYSRAVLENRTGLTLCYQSDVLDVQSTQDSQFSDFDATSFRFASFGGNKQVSPRGKKQAKNPARRQSRSSVPTSLLSSTNFFSVGTSDAGDEENLEAEIKKRCLALVHEPYISLGNVLQESSGKSHDDASVAEPITVVARPPHNRALSITLTCNSTASLSEVLCMAARCWGSSVMGSVGHYETFFFIVADPSAGILATDAAMENIRSGLRADDDYNFASESSALSLRTAVGEHADADGVVRLRVCHILEARLASQTAVARRCELYSCEDAVRNAMIHPWGDYVPWDPPSECAYSMASKRSPFTFKTSASISSQSDPLAPASDGDFGEPVTGAAGLEPDAGLALHVRVKDRSEWSPAIEIPATRRPEDKGEIDCGDDVLIFELEDSHNSRWWRMEKMDPTLIAEDAAAAVGAGASVQHGRSMLTFRNDSSANSASDGPGLCTAHVAVGSLTLASERRLKSYTAQGRLTSAKLLGTGALGAGLRQRSPVFELSVSVLPENRHSHIVISPRITIRNELDVAVDIAQASSLNGSCDDDFSRLIACLEPGQEQALHWLDNEAPPAFVVRMSAMTRIDGIEMTGLYKTGAITCERKCGFVKRGQGTSEVTPPLATNRTAAASIESSQKCNRGKIVNLRTTTYVAATSYMSNSADAIAILRVRREPRMPNVLLGKKARGVAGLDTLVVLEPADTAWPPYRIENNTGRVVRYRQRAGTGDSKHLLNADFASDLGVYGEEDTLSGSEDDVSIPSSTCISNLDEAQRSEHESDASNPLVAILQIGHRIPADATASEPYFVVMGGKDAESETADAAIPISGVKHSSFSLSTFLGGTSKATNEKKVRPDDVHWRLLQPFDSADYAWERPLDATSISRKVGKRSLSVEFYDDAAGSFDSHIDVSLDGAMGLVKYVRLRRPPPDVADAVISGFVDRKHHFLPEAWVAGGFASLSRDGYMYVFRDAKGKHLSAVVDVLANDIASYQYDAKKVVDTVTDWTHGDDDSARVDGINATSAAGGGTDYVSSKFASKAVPTGLDTFLQLRRMEVSYKAQSLTSWVEDFGELLRLPSLANFRDGEAVMRLLVDEKFLIQRDDIGRLWTFADRDSDLQIQRGRCFAIAARRDGVHVCLRAPDVKAARDWVSRIRDMTDDRKNVLKCRKRPSFHTSLHTQVAIEVRADGPTKVLEFIEKPVDKRSEPVHEVPRTFSRSATIRAKVRKHWEAMISDADLQSRRKLRFPQGSLIPPTLSRHKRDMSTDSDKFPASFVQDKPSVHALWFSIRLPALSISFVRVSIEEVPLQCSKGREDSGGSNHVLLQANSEVYSANKGTYLEIGVLTLCEVDVRRLQRADGSIEARLRVEHAQLDNQLSARPLFCVAMRPQKRRANTPTTPHSEGKAHQPALWARASRRADMPCRAERQHDVLYLDAFVVHLKPLEFAIDHELAAHAVAMLAEILSDESTSSFPKKRRLRFPRRRHRRRAATNSPDNSKCDSGPRQSKTKSGSPQAISPQHIFQADALSDDEGENENDRRVSSSDKFPAQSQIETASNALPKEPSLIFPAKSQVRWPSCYVQNCDTGQVSWTVALNAESSWLGAHSPAMQSVFCRVLRLHALDACVTLKGGVSAATRGDVGRALGSSAQLDAALAMLGQLDEAQFSVDSLFVDNAFAATAESLGRRVTKFYTFALLRQVHRALGSLDLVKMPYAFLRDVGSGVQDFLWQPIEGALGRGGTFFSAATSAKNLDERKKRKKQWPQDRANDEEKIFFFDDDVDDAALFYGADSEESERNFSSTDDEDEQEAETAPDMHLPLTGISAYGLASGVARGTSSLVGTALDGGLNVVSQVTAGIGGTVAALSMDHAYTTRRAMSRAAEQREKPTHSRKGADRRGGLSSSGSSLRRRVMELKHASCIESKVYQSVSSAPCTPEEKCTEGADKPVETDEKKQVSESQMNDAGSIFPKPRQKRASNALRSTELSRRQTTSAHGLFLKGARELGTGLFDGVTGVLMEPYRAVNSNPSDYTAIAKATARGIIGVAVKPTVGVIDFATRGVEGVRHAGRYFGDGISEAIRGGTSHYDEQSDCDYDEDDSLSLDETAGVRSPSARSHASEGALCSCDAEIQARRKRSAKRNRTYWLLSEWPSWRDASRRQTHSHHARLRHPRVLASDGSLVAYDAAGAAALQLVCLGLSQPDSVFGVLGGDEWSQQTVTLERARASINFHAAVTESLLDERSEPDDSAECESTGTADLLWWSGPGGPSTMSLDAQFDTALHQNLEEFEKRKRWLVCMSLSGESDEVLRYIEERQDESTLTLWEVNVDAIDKVLARDARAEMHIVLAHRPPAEGEEVTNRRWRQQQHFTFPPGVVVYDAQTRLDIEIVSKMTAAFCGDIERALQSLPRTLTLHEQGATLAWAYALKSEQSSRFIVTQNLGGAPPKERRACVIKGSALLVHDVDDRQDVLSSLTRRTAAQHISIRRIIPLVDVRAESAEKVLSSNEGNVSAASPAWKRLSFLGGDAARAILLSFCGSTQQSTVRIDRFAKVEWDSRRELLFVFDDVTTAHDWILQINRNALVSNGQTSCSYMYLPVTLAGATLEQRKKLAFLFDSGIKRSYTANDCVADDEDDGSNAFDSFVSMENNRRGQLRQIHAFTPTVPPRRKRGSPIADAMTLRRSLVNRGKPRKPHVPRKLSSAWV